MFLFIIIKNTYDDDEESERRERAKQESCACKNKKNSIAIRIIFGSNSLEFVVTTSDSSTFVFVLIMDSSASPLPRFNKCCFMFGLRSGVLIFVSLEALFWALLSFAAIFSEVKYIINVDIGEFSDVLDNDWYYYLLFGYARELIDERIRSNFFFLFLFLELINISLQLISLSVISYYR